VDQVLKADSLSLSRLLSRTQIQEQQRISSVFQRLAEILQLGDKPHGSALATGFRFPVPVMAAVLV
jgi:hypothetical protein